MEPKPINNKEKFTLFSEYWSPKIITQMNDYHFKIAKIQGEFIWHSHPETDETFLQTTPHRVGRKTYSTVTLFARFRGWSTSKPRRAAIW